MTRPAIDPGSLCLPDCDVRTVVAALAFAGILTTVQTVTWTATEDGPAPALITNRIAAAADAAVRAADALLERLGRAAEVPPERAHPGA